MEAPTRWERPKGDFASRNSGDTRRSVIRRIYPHDISDVYDAIYDISVLYVIFETKVVGFKKNA